MAQPNTPHILIIEDDPALQNQVSALLTQKGWQISQAQTGQSGLVFAVSSRFDLILLDVRLPDMSGFNLLSRLRQSHKTPVIMITACGAEQDRIMGLQSGADDYLPKPFNFTELELRIAAVLRRYQPQQDTNQQSLKVDELHLDKAQQLVTYNKQPLTLTRIQFKLLWTLVQNHQEILSKAYLYQIVLEKQFSQYDRSLDMHLSRVRRKLVELGMPETRIVTAHGRGYGFS